MSMPEFNQRAVDVWVDIQASHGQAVRVIADALRREYTEGAQCLAKCLTEAKSKLDETERKLVLLRTVAESAARVADRSLAVDDSGHGFCIFCGLRKRAEGHCCEAAALRRNVKAAREGGAL